METPTVQMRPCRLLALCHQPMFTYHFSVDLILFWWQHNHWLDYVYKLLVNEELHCLMAAVFRQIADFKLCTKFAAMNPFFQLALKMLLTIYYSFKTNTGFSIREVMFSVALDTCWILFKTKDVGKFGCFCLLSTILAQRDRTWIQSPAACNVQHRSSWEGPIRGRLGRKKRSIQAS